MISKEELSGQGETEELSHQEQGETERPEVGRPRFGGVRFETEELIKDLKEYERRLRRETEEKFIQNFMQRPRGPVIVEAVDWDKLSENGKKIYNWVMVGLARDWLPELAEEEGIDVQAAMDELREHGILDESDPHTLRLVSRRL